VVVALPDRMDSSHALPFRLGTALAAVMAAQSSTGLAFSSRYTDPLWAKSAWVGNDWVTLLVALPLLLLSQRAAAKGSPRGTLLWLGALGYGVYNYSYYLLGAALNLFFPFYVAGVLLSGIALGRAVYRLQPEAWSSATRLRISGTYFGLVGVGLGVAWLGQWARYLSTGVAPDIGPEAFRLVAALDLTLMSPLMLAAAWAAWRRSSWAAVVGTLTGVQGGLYTLVLTAGSAVGVSNGVVGSAEQLPIWAAFTVCNVAATALVLWPGRVTSSSAPWTPSTPSAAAGHP
jgi:hypothetical protein